MHYKPHLDVYTLLLLTNFVPHLTFHVFKLMLLNKNRKRLDWKQTYDPCFDFLGHRLEGEVEYIMGVNEIKCLGFNLGK